MTKIDEMQARRSAGARTRVARLRRAARDGVQGLELRRPHQAMVLPRRLFGPEAKVEMRVGGPFEVCMRSPEGVDHWTRGTFTEVMAPEPSDDRPSRGRPLRRRSAVQRRYRGEFQRRRLRRHADGGGARPIRVAGRGAGGADAEGRARGLAPDTRQARGGSSAHADGVVRSVVHGAFHFERTYDATLEQVYKALSDEAAKSRWFYRARGLATHRARHGLPGRRPRAGQGRL